MKVTLLDIVNSVYAVQQLTSIKIRDGKVNYKLSRMMKSFNNCFEEYSKSREALLAAHGAVLNEAKNNYDFPAIDGDDGAAARKQYNEEYKKMVEVEVTDLKLYPLTMEEIEAITDAPAGIWSYLWWMCPEDM